MNREILFRGKRKENGEWIEGYLYRISEKLNPFIMLVNKNGESHEVIPETVGQYTGLTDKYVKKIFEGDITKHRSNYNGNDVIAVVTYSDGYFLAMTEDNAGFNLSDKLEVIGNIHDNSELLEVTECTKS